MNMSSFGQVLDSALPTKLCILLLLYTIYLYSRKKDSEGSSTAFLALLGILLIRDVLTALFPSPDLYFLSDIFVYSLTLFIVISPFDRARTILLTVIAVNLAAALVFVGLIVFDLNIPVQPRLFSLLLVADAVFCAVFGFIRRSHRQSLARQLVASQWPVIAVFLVIYALLSIWLGYDDPLFMRVVVPLSYGWILIAALTLINLHESELLAALSYYEGSVDALYNLFRGTNSALKGNFSAEDVLRSLNDVLRTETGADGGLVFLVDEFEDVIRAKACSGTFPPPFPLPTGLTGKPERIAAYMEHLQLNLGETLFGEIARTAKPVYIPDALTDSRIGDHGDGTYPRITSFMAVPLMIEERIIGVSAMVRTASGSMFDEAAFDRLRLLADFGTLVVNTFFAYIEADEKSGMARSASIAAEIQRTVVPKRIPQFPSLAIGAVTVPALGISGDYHDVIQTRKDKVIGIAGDVAGKGVQAALVMVMIRAILHLITNTDKDLPTILAWVNRGITGRIEIDHYATLGMVAIDLATNSLEYSSAGHQPLLLYRRVSNAVEFITQKSLPIGIERTTSYQSTHLPLGDGDIVVLYTDGVVESIDGEGRQFGQNGLANLVKASHDLAPRDIAARIRDALATFAGSVRQHDDQTVLVFKMRL